MSERWAPSTESWRPQRRSTVFDPQMQRMAAIAGAVVAVAALGLRGLRADRPRQPRTVPVIEADSRPVRVRPDNPGGMQVAGADEQIMGGSGTGQADAMAPAPEAPQLGALRAQIEAARQPPPAAAAAARAAGAAPRAAVPPPACLPRPAPGSRGPGRCRRAAPRRRAPVLAGGTQVQLAAVGTEQAAMAEWQRLAKRMPELLAPPARGATGRARRQSGLAASHRRLRRHGAGHRVLHPGPREGSGCSIASF